MIERILQALLPLSAHEYLSRKKIEYLNGGYFGFNGLDRKLEKYLNFDGGFYVELGANDGISVSNTYYFELKRGWRGVLVEPSPSNFLKCLSLRGVNNSVHCNACVSFGYKERFVEMEYANLMTVSKGLDSDLTNLEEHINFAKKFMPINEKIFSFGALAKPLSVILDESKAPKKIDLLSLDVEGAELEILKGVDFEKYEFNFMLIECRNFDRLSAYLSGVGYEYIEALSKHDYLFKRSSN